MSLKNMLNNAEVTAAQAEAAVEEAIDAAEELPRTAQELLALSQIPACLRIEERVSSYALGAAALDFDRYIKRQMARALAERVSEKLAITHEGYASEYSYAGPEHVYRGEVFVFTRAELRDLVEDSLRAGRLVGASL